MFTFRIHVEEILNNCKHIDIVTGMPFPYRDSRLEVTKKILNKKIPYLCIGEHDVGPFLFSENEIDNFIKWSLESFAVHEDWIKKIDIDFQEGDRHPSYSPSIHQVCAIAADEIVRYLNQYANIRTANGCFSVNPITSTVKLYSFK